MNLLQGPLGQLAAVATEAGPGFQSGNKFDSDMCVLAAGQGRAGQGWAAGEVARGLTSWWPTCLPCQWQRRNRERTRETENETKTKTKTTEKLCEKGGKMQALFSLLLAQRA